MVIVLAAGMERAGRWARRRATTAAVLGALAWAIGGCGDAAVSEVLVSVDNDGRAERPEYLLFSWLMCGDYLRRDDRVPERGALARGANPIATVLIQVDTSGATRRGVFIRGMVGERVVSSGSAVIEIRPGVRNGTSVRLYDGVAPDGEDVARKLDWCGGEGDAGAGDAGAPKTDAPAGDAADAGAGTDTRAPDDAPGAAADAATSDGPGGGPPTPEPGLVGWWPLDEITDAVTRDHAGGGNHASLLMGPSLVPGRVGPRALDLSGNLDLAVIADPPDERLDFGAGDFTAAAWVKTTQRPSGAPDLVVKWPSTTTGGNMRGGWALTLPMGAALFKCYSGGNPSVQVTGTPINDGAWHHVAGRKTATELALFVDGRLVATRPHALGSVSNAAPLQLGGFGNSSTLAFDGQLDDVRVYNRALTPQEIAALAAATEN
jgi:hypothetical protein